MHRSRNARTLATLLSVVALALGAAAPGNSQQKTPPTVREILLSQKGREVIIMDRTGGQEQFVGSDASRSYIVTLQDVAQDYMVVSRNVDSDKRSFVYPLSVIRRIVTMYENRPYDRILIEMY
jgi:hypothetical protein